MALRLRVVLALGGLALAASLGGCATRTPYEQLMAAKPTGSPFAKALFADYAAQARALGLADVPARTAFDADSAISLTPVQPDVAAAALAFAAKAQSAADGDEPLPEAAPIDNTNAETDRLGLLRVLYYGRTKAPAEAAHTQAQYDCWVIDGAVPALDATATACRRAFLAGLAHLKAIPGVMAEPPTEAPAGEQPAAGAGPNGQ